MKSYYHRKGSSMGMGGKSVESIRAMRDRADSGSKLSLDEHMDVMRTRREWLQAQMNGSTGTEEPEG